MNQKCLLTGLFLFTFLCSKAQDALNVANESQQSPNTAAASKSADTRVDYFTGMPAISVPLFSYSDKNGLSLGISANFTGGGGIRNGESASIIGMGWNLSAGGIITRTVRGIPDDMPTYGYMYAAAIPADFRANGNKYYYDSIDAQQDVFQFSVNGRSGKFVIGKNKEVAVMPASKIKIEFTAQPNEIITSFRITTEDGVKYVFSQGESTTQSITGHGNDYYRSKYTDYPHNSAWYITHIISPFNTDTIQFTYTSRTIRTAYAYPQIVFFKYVGFEYIPADSYYADGTNKSDIVKLSKITFPDKKQVDFLYSYKYKYDDTDYALAKIKVSDTVFRYGYAFDYLKTYTGKIVKTLTGEEPDSVSTSYSTVLLLKTITPYTLKQADKGYVFTYNTPFLSRQDPLYTANDSMKYAYDHWGFFNGQNNGNTTITTNIPSFLSADRNANAYATQNSLAYMQIPSGGLIHYEYELHDKYPAVTSTGQVVVTGNTAASQNNITLSQLYNEQHQLVFILDKSVSRVDAAPLSGTCNLVVNIKNTAGTITYASTTLSLYDLFYLGIRTWTFNVPNGTYKLETALSGGGTITAGSFPFGINWENRTEGVNAGTAGGIRIKKITRSNPGDTSLSAAVSEEYKYISENGKSSGFLGNIPKYDYALEQYVTSTATTTLLTALSSDPMNAINFAEGNRVGYSRVEVIKGTAAKNLGKVVYEFTDLRDVNTNYYTSTFPYAPDNLKSWGLGLLKKVMVYDSSDNLIKKTTHTFTFPVIGYVNANFKVLRIGRTKTTYATDPVANPTTTRAFTYVAREGYFQSGWARLDKTTDTFYHYDGSKQTSYTSYTYDANYNISKVVTPYSQTRGQTLETRLYYPYNYTVGGAIGKLRDSSILTALVSTEKWLLNPAPSRAAITAAGITDFQQIANGAIKPYKTYSLETNKPLDVSVVGLFDETVLNRDPAYFKEQAAYLLYDIEGNLLQVKNTPHNESSCVIMDYNKQYVVAKTSLTVNNNIAYTSFESDGTGNWTINSASRDMTGAVTGKISYNLSNGNVTKSALDPATTYLVSFWLKSGSSATLNGSAVTTISTHNGWSLVSKEITGISSVTISGTGLIDELRLHPDYCNMETYTYEPNVGVTSTCDANNTIVYTEYDGLNRVKLLRDNDRNIIKKIEYVADDTDIDSAQLWVGTARSCRPNSSSFDSVYTDMNPYSDTYWLTKKVLYAGYSCACPHQANPTPPYNPGNIPYLNAACKPGYRYNTSSYQIKVNDVWVWRCVYQYRWSDGTPASPSFYQDGGASACSVGGSPD